VVGLFKRIPAVFPCETRGTWRVGCCSTVERVGRAIFEALRAWEGSGDDEGWISSRRVEPGQRGESGASGKLEAYYKVSKAISYSGKANARHGDEPGVKQVSTPA